MCHTSRRRRLLYSRRETKHAERIEATVQVNSLFFENVLLRHIFFFSLSLDATRVVLLRRRLIPETLIYISAFEPFFALDDVACAMRSRARSKKKPVWRRDAKTRRIRAREETGCERRDVGRAVPFRGGFRVLCFFSSNLLFWVFFVLVSCHHHHHLSMNNNEA